MGKKGLQPGDIIPQAGSWENFEMNLFGRDLVAFTSFGLNYESSFDINYGKNGEPVSWAIKEYKRTAKAELNMDEMEYLFNLASFIGGDLLKLPPAPVTASCEMDNWTFKLTIPAVKIIKFDMNWKQGDTKISVPLDFGVTSYPIITLA